MHTPLLRILLATCLFVASILPPLTPRAAAQDADAALAHLDFRQVVKEAKEKVFPTVVFIKVVREDMQRGEKKAQEVAGSGVIISADGEVLSNWHVVDKAIEVRCMLQDGRAFPAKVLGSDKDVDVALLKLELPTNSPPLAFATLGDSTKLTEGDFVMAMGAPFGLARSVSIGIISCTKRYLPTASEYSIWLQTDASISPGNSGGPLVNTRGEVIGLNTRGTASFFGGDNGFAVPIEVAQEVSGQIRKYGKSDWSWTGLQLQPLKDFNRNVYFPENEGVLVAETDPDSPARRAGIEAGDRLVKLNGQPFNGLTQEDLPDLRRDLGLLPKDQPAKIELVRKGETRIVELIPRAKGKVEGDTLDCPRWDFTVRAINQFDNPNLYFQRNEGVFVYGIKVPGNAASTGLAMQDILLKIDGQDVKTLDDVKSIHAEAVANVKSKHRIVLTVLRNGELRQIVLDFSREHQKD
ncbi:MAG TPA: trypsin-like peptidase domain-containing protein [Verrucomicrobiota bacterium]|nr:trypsin-like peptidase domain-containing protein [Verrucomicrobiota bacterium]